MPGPDLPAGGHPIALLEANIEDGHVRIEGVHPPDRLRFGAGLTDHHDVVLGLEQVPETATDDLVVVEQEHADPFAHALIIAAADPASQPMAPPARDQGGRTRDFRPWRALAAALDDGVVRDVPPSSPGLTRTEAAARLARDGPNRLPPPRRPSVVRRFIGQLVHFFALMLWVAGVLAFVAGLPELGVAIFAVIVLNATFAFVQEHRADRAAERLRALLPERVTVRRDGRRTAGRSQRRGDGRRPRARARGSCRRPTPTLVVANCALVDTSLLTGESAPLAVDPW